MAQLLDGRLSDERREVDPRRQRREAIR